MAEPEFSLDRWADDGGRVPNVLNDERIDDDATTSGGRSFEPVVSLRRRQALCPRPSPDRGWGDPLARFSPPDHGQTLRP